MKAEMDTPMEFEDRFGRDRLLRRLHANDWVLAASILIIALRLARVTDDKAGRKTDVRFSLYRIPDVPDEEPG